MLAGMPVQVMDISRFWRKSVFCALRSGKIAKSRGMDAAERFFIEGLLRDIGCDFAEVGAELIRSWGMPEQIEVVASYKLTGP